jgi:hypothetical protein
MSALGQKQTYALQKANVRFTSESGHMQRTSPCLLRANSGHRGYLQRTSWLSSGKPHDYIGSATVWRKYGIEDVAHRAIVDHKRETLQ